MNKFLILAGLAVGLAVPALAQYTVPTYTTLSASGTTTSVVYFATSPAQQVRIVQAFVTSDLATANLSFRTGGTPLTITKTNAAGTTIDVASTNGFAAGDWVLLEKKTGVITNAVIASFTGATNIVFTYNVPATAIDDQIYKLGTAVNLLVGATTNKTFSGVAIFVGNNGRPVQVYLNGTSACSLDAITARYE
ncbi:MAG: hypothetical protein NT154_15270 [Verrucomicrobia bacterium]|nr:hypothetical protein [Verrucomicrobiota bacterium]